MILAPELAGLMLTNLFWLTDTQKERLNPFLPKSHCRPRADERRVLSRTNARLHAMTDADGCPLRFIMTAVRFSALHRSWRPAEQSAFSQVADPGPAS